MNPSMDIFVLSTLLAHAMQACEDSALPVEQQAWQLVQHDLYVVDTVEQFVTKVKRIQTLNPRTTLSNVYGHALELIGANASVAHAG